MHLSHTLSILIITLITSTNTALAVTHKHTELYQAKTAQKFTKVELVKVIKAGIESLGLTNADDISSPDDAAEKILTRFKNDTINPAPTDLYTPSILTEKVGEVQINEIPLIFCYYSLPSRLTPTEKDITWKIYNP